MLEYIFNFRGFIDEMISSIHENDNLPSEIKDSWSELSFIMNIEHLHDEVVAY